MKSILTLAAAASIAGTTAFAAQHEMQDEQMTMLQQRLGEALAECNIDADEEMMMGLTMAQVSGIVLAAGSEDGNDECQDIEAIVQDSM